MWQTGTRSMSGTCMRIASRISPWIGASSSSTTSRCSPLLFYILRFCILVCERLMVRKLLYIERGAKMSEVEHRNSKETSDRP